MADFTTLQEMILEARKRLSPSLWDFVAGGTESEMTLRHNRYGLDRLAFRPRVLRDVSRVDTATTFLGRRLSIPIMLAPIGSLVLIDPAGAVAPALAAAQRNTLMFYSTFADPPLDIVTSKVPHPIVVALYIRDGDAWLDEQVDKIKSLGCAAVCIVTEAPYYSRRERDLMNKFLSRGSRSGTYANTQRILRDGGTPEEIKTANARMVTARVTWKTIQRIQQRSSLPIILKGIATAEDARIAVEHGVAGIYVSNHGGRQLDHCHPSIDVLPEIVDAVAGKAEVIMDGGIYRASDALKAIALGARAICIGRLQCWALAAGGEAALVRALEILEEELIIGMGLLGVTKLSELNRSYVSPVVPATPPALLSPFPIVLGR